MLSVLDAIFGVVVVGLALGVLGASVRRGCVGRYFFLNLFVGVMLLGDGLRYAVLYYYGFSSHHYFYTFYLTDALLVTVTYLLILSFFDVIFEHTPLRSQVRWALFFFIILVGGMSYAMTSRSMPNFYSHLLVEFQQNMYFAAVVLTVLLWISLNHLRVYDRQMALLIAGLGISLSALAANYAFQNLLSREQFEAAQEILRRVPALATMAELGLWCYALASVAEGVPAADRKLEMMNAEAKGVA